MRRKELMVSAEFRVYRRVCWGEAGKTERRRCQVPFDVLDKAEMIVEYGRSDSRAQGFIPGFYCCSHTTNTTGFPVMLRTAGTETFVPSWNACRCEGACRNNVRATSDVLAGLCTESLSKAMAFVCRTDVNLA